MTICFGARQHFTKWAEFRLLELSMVYDWLKRHYKLKEGRRFDLLASLSTKLCLSVFMSQSIFYREIPCQNISSLLPTYLVFDRTLHKSNFLGADLQDNVVAHRFDWTSRQRYRRAPIAFFILSLLPLASVLSTGTIGSYNISI